LLEAIQVWMKHMTTTSKSPADAKRLAEFRTRLADRSPRWLIDIAGRTIIKLDLTPEQQAQLRSATKQTFPSLTLIFQSDVIESSVQTALCNLEARDVKEPKEPRRPGPDE
jgi:hypothetical protein